MIEFDFSVFHFRCSLAVPILVSVIFVALKLLELVTWSWMIVFLPLMIWFGLFAAILVLVIIWSVIQKFR